MLPPAAVFIALPILSVKRIRHHERQGDLAREAVGDDRARAVSNFFVVLPVAAPG